NYVAFYASEACLVKMLYLAGFGFVYRLAQIPDHTDFDATPTSKALRTALVASRLALNSSLLVIVPEPSAVVKHCASTSEATPLRRAGLLWGFARKPWPEKLATLRRLVGQR